MKESIQFWRDDFGVVHIQAPTRDHLHWGQGYAHGLDRGMQCVMMRILGQGRVSELLRADDESERIDRFFRRMNWSQHFPDMDQEVRAALIHYSSGLNAALSERWPWELRALGVPFEPWQPEDSLMLSRMVGYLTLVQSQEEIERFLVELIQAGCERAYLDELFPDLLEGIDMELIQKVRLTERVVPKEELWNLSIPRMMASNNWVLSGSKTSSGKPVLANDPHLEINRLPNVWCEHVLIQSPAEDDETEENYFMGGSMPGMPGILTGRNKHLAWGVTYAFIDSVDSWVEHCREGSYYRESEPNWRPFRRRTEAIQRKGKDDLIIPVYENENGLLHGDPEEEGYYLVTRWAAAESGPKSFKALLGLWDAKTVDEAMDLVKQVETGWNFVLGDNAGDIAFQMSGNVPKRPNGSSGIFPMAAWQEGAAWQGFVDPNKLPNEKNPECGFIVTANHDLNHLGAAKPITASMASYRAERIAEVLENQGDLTCADMARLQYDVKSLQAKRFMALLRPLIPDTVNGTILKEWDFTYGIESKAAPLFESFYRELNRLVFGESLGEQVFHHLWEETGLFTDFYGNFDRILLSESSLWFRGQTREQIYQKALENVLDKPLKSWGKYQQFTMKHLIFGGKTPRFLGFDRGPIEAKGGRATVHQGQIYRSGGRDTTFMPSIRLISDLAEQGCHTNLAGGPSDRRFSRWYDSELKAWYHGIYKQLDPGENHRRGRFP